MERHREHVLLKEARETMREEIEHNNTTMKGVVTTRAAQRTLMKNNVDLLTKVVEDPKQEPMANEGGK